MMAGVSTIQKNSAGGPIIGPGVPTWTLNGSPISIVGDLVTPHGEPPHSPAPTMVEGTGWMTINGIKVVVEGCLASCGHTADGQQWFNIPKVS